MHCRATTGSLSALLIWALADQKDVHDLLSAVLPYLKTPTKRDEALKAVTAISTRPAPPLKPGRGRTIGRPENQRYPALHQKGVLNQNSSS